MTPDNSVADVSEEISTCGYCYGSGKAYSVDEWIKIARAVSYFGLGWNFRDALRECRRAKTRHADCPACGGYGNFVRQY